MSEGFWLAIQFAVCVVAVGLGFWAGGARATLRLRPRITEAYRKVNASGERADASDRKAGEYLGTIESILKERDEWRRWWQESAAGHAKAQSMLLEERDHLVLQLKRAGLSPRTNRAIDRVVSECNEYDKARILPPHDDVGPGTDNAPGKPLTTEE